MHKLTLMQIEHRFAVIPLVLYYKRMFNSSLLVLPQQTFEITPKGIGVHKPPKPEIARPCKAWVQRAELAFPVPSCMMRRCRVLGFRAPTSTIQTL